MRTAWFFVFACLAQAQWLDYKTPGIPRMPDGKPNLSAPAPRSPDGRPDFSGLWQPDVTSAYRFNVLRDAKDQDILRPEAEALFLKRVTDFRRDDPVTNCLPGGPSDMLNMMYRIIQSPAVTAVLYESNYLLDRPTQKAHNRYMEAPKTLQEAILFYADFENCKAFLSNLRWPDGSVKCPRCQSEKILWIEKERVWKCYGKHDHAKFSLKTGTVMEDSPISLDKWLVALWLVVNCKNGISSCEVAKDLGITQKSAWFLNHRIRMMLHNGSVEKLSGHVEVDETFIGGKARNMHVSERKRRITGTGGKDKTAVMGIVQRGGKVRTTVVPNRKKSALQAEVRKHVEAGSALYTDALLSYNGLESDYAHQVVDHAVSYVDGAVHTNTMENFWALLKRGISGTYVSVEPFHLFRYLDEQAYRYNFRKDMDDYDRFKLAASQMVGKRLTWNEATGKNHETQTYPN